MKNKKWFLSFLFVFFSAAVLAEDALLSITCDGVNADAEVYVNGKFKGQCPVDIGVPPGSVKLRATKKLDNEHDGVFEKELKLAEGTVKRQDVVLESSLNLAGKAAIAAKTEQERIAAEKAAAEHKALIPKLISELVQPKVPDKTPYAQLELIVNPDIKHQVETDERFRSPAGTGNELKIYQDRSIDGVPDRTVVTHIYKRNGICYTISHKANGETIEGISDTTGTLLAVAPNVDVMQSLDLELSPKYFYPIEEGKEWFISKKVLFSNLLEKPKKCYVNTKCTTRERAVAATVFPGVPGDIVKNECLSKNNIVDGSITEAADTRYYIEYLGCSVSDPNIKTKLGVDYKLRSVEWLDSKIP